MKSELAVLIEILEEQKALQAALVDLSERKTKVIASGDTAALSAVVEEEKAMLGRIKAVERKQSSCIGKLAAHLAVPPDEVSMSLIIERAEGGQKERLAGIRDELSGLIGKQLRSNDINMKLLQMNMDYIQFLVNASSNRQTSPTYGNGGAVKKAAGSVKRLLDRKV